MAKKMVVTNLRMEENDYLQAKAIAAEMGMSLNEYFNYLSQISSRSAVFGKKTNPYQKLLDLANTKFEGKGMGASEEDEIIYGV
jgi:hypothetical protein